MFDYSSVYLYTVGLCYVCPALFCGLALARVLHGFLIRRRRLDVFRISRRDHVR